MRTGQSTRGATHLIKVACEVASGKRQSMDIFGADYPTPDGICIRDYIHVSDLVDTHYLALRRMRDGGGSLIANCGYGPECSVREVINTVTAVAGRELDVRVDCRRAGDPSVIVANADRARSELGWRPMHDDLSEIVSHAQRSEEVLRKRNW